MGAHCTQPATALRWVQPDAMGCDALPVAHRQRLFVNAIRQSLLGFTRPPYPLFVSSGWLELPTEISRAALPARCDAATSRARTGHHLGRMFFEFTVTEGYMKTTIKLAALGAIALAASSTAALATSEMPAGITTGIALGAPLPEGVYDISIASYGSRSKGYASHEHSLRPAGMADLVDPLADRRRPHHARHHHGRRRRLVARLRLWHGQLAEHACRWRYRLELGQWLERFGPRRRVAAEHAVSPEVPSAATILPSRAAVRSATWLTAGT